MTSEKDEFFYHENLVHVAAMTHPQPASVRSWSAAAMAARPKRSLKHPSIKSVTLAEIDLAVVDISRKYLQAVHSGALDDPRLDAEIEDGFAYVRDATDRSISSCWTSPIAGGPSEPLYTPEFYRACAARL